MRMATLDLSEAVKRKRFAAPLCVLSLGIVNSLLLLIRGWWRRLWLSSTAAALMSLRPEDDEHLVPFHPRPCFNFTDVREILLQFLQDPRPAHGASFRVRETRSWL